MLPMMAIREITANFFFYLRLLPPFLAKGVTLAAGLAGPNFRQGTERALLPLCNRLFRPVIDPAQFMTVKSFSESQDVSDFFTLCRATGMNDTWFAGKRILDAGCGSGLFSLAAARKGAQEVVGIDIDEPRIPYARRSAERQEIRNATFRVMSVYEMDFPDCHFDRVISHTVFEHLPDVPAALSSLYRVLKPGGEIFITHNAFRSRYGAHVAHFINLPWPCAFFSDEAVLGCWNRNREHYLKAHPLDKNSDPLDLLAGGLLSLNRLKISEVVKAVRASPFEAVQLVPYGEEKALLAAMPWLQKWSGLHEYLRGSLALRLRRGER